MSRDPHDWRVEQYLSMGFSPDESNALAHSREENGFHVYHGDVRRRLDEGMSRAEALVRFVSDGVKV